jgi:hypothetical protein
MPLTLDKATAWTGELCWAFTEVLTLCLYHGFGVPNQARSRAMDIGNGKLVIFLVVDLGHK